MATKHVPYPLKTYSDKKIKDDTFVIIKNDVEKIQHRPTMYIANLGELGVFHLCKEVIDNGRDECLKKDSPGNTIQIFITNKQIIVIDNGRGIPTEKIREVYETIQAGTNMTRSSGSTAGENGVGGSTCALALSSYLEVTTMRPSEKCKLTIIYKNGVFVEERREECGSNEHGLKVTFRPSRKLLGCDTIPIEMLRDWLKDFDYTLPRGINMIYDINGEATTIRHKELYTFFEQFIPVDARLCNELVFDCSGDLKEEFDDETYDRHFDVAVAITYSNPEMYKGDDIRHSWMNMIYTPQDGSHVNGIIKAFSRVLAERVLRKNKKLEANDIKKDILAHFNIVVNASTNFAHMFTSQSKHSVRSIYLEKAIEDAAYKVLSNTNNSTLNEMVEVVIGNHRARIEGEKARKVASSTKAIKSWQKPDSYYPCSTAKTQEPKELFLVEGNSAGGGLKGARDAKYQAILTFKGKSLNVWDLTLERALQSLPWLNLVKVLECGIVPTFDIKKLYFDKIIISTDADIDGYHIRVGICAFFVKFLPEIIRAGKLYIAEPPLYKLTKDKDVYYVASQTEYLQTCVDSIGGMTLEFPEMK